MLGCSISNAPKSNSFEVSFIHLKLREKHKEDYVEVGGGNTGMGLQES